MQSVKVHFLPQLVKPEELRGGTCVVIDVLRATTTIAFALEAGAQEVIPCLEVDDARHVGTNFAAGTFVLGGERGGTKIDSFHLGNSPDEYTPRSVGGKTVIFTTTNGTRAMLHAREASAILLGSLVNAEAVAVALRDHPQIDILCAGTDGKISMDDVVTAGAIVDLLQSDGLLTNDEGEIAATVWQSARVDKPLDTQKLLERLRTSLGGQNLVELGMDADIERAAQFACLRIVPMFNDGKITPLAAAAS